MTETPFTKEELARREAAREAAKKGRLIRIVAGGDDTTLTEVITDEQTRSGDNRKEE